MYVPGWDLDNGVHAYKGINKHDVVEEKYWAIDMTNIRQGT